MSLEKRFDVSLLQPTTLVADVEKVCTKARDAGSGSVCVPPLFIAIAKKLLDGSEVKVATAISFPYGYAPSEVKLSEMMLAILDGADEIFVTVNIMAIKNNDWHYVAKEVNQVVPVITSREKALKMLANLSFLTEEEVGKLSKLIEPAGIEVLLF